MTKFHIFWFLYSFGLFWQEEKQDAFFFFLQLKVIFMKEDFSF